MSNIENFINTAKKDIALIKTIQKTKFSEVYECKLDGKDAILKIKMDCTFENEISIEEIIVDQLHKLNLAPRILLTDTEEKVVIYEKVVGSDPGTVSKANIIPKCAKQLKKLHNSNIICDDCSSFESKIKKYEHAIAQNSPNSLCRSAFKFIYELVARDKHQVFCHNDLNLSNIMYSDDIFFIDWDYAGFNHPYFDLALLFNAMNLTSNEEYNFLSIYADQENNIDHELLKEYKKMSLYVEYLWIVATSSQENPKYATRFDELSTLFR
jgi:thiamine kinase-like enzyme